MEKFRPTPARVEIQALKKQRDERHVKNLMGGFRIDGLTGFYHGKYYDNGVVRLPKIRG
jgi:hypothetical protein